MRSIFTYPLNQATDFVDPRYIGTATTGWKKRVNELLSGTYLSWPALDPVADLGTTVNQAIQMQSRFTYYLDSYKIGGKDYNLSMYDLHSLPIAIGRKKLLDSEEVNSAVLTGANNHVEMTFTNAHTFVNGDTVTIDNFDGTIGQEPPLNFDVEVVDSDTILLKDGSGNYFRYYILGSADISTGEATAASPCVFKTTVDNTLSDGMEVTLEGFDGTLNEHNGETFYVQNRQAREFNVSYDAAGTDILAYQVPAPDTQIVTFELQTNGRIYVQLPITDLYDHTSVTFDTGALQSDEAFSTALFTFNQTVTPTYLKNVGVAGQGYYELYTDEDLSIPIRWRTTDGNLNENDFKDVQASMDFDGTTNKIQIYNGYTTQPVNLYKNKRAFHIQTETGAQFDGIDYSTIYYTDTGGVLYSDSALTTPLEFDYWKIPVPYAYNKPSSVGHASIDYDDAGVAISGDDIVIDVSGVSNQGDISNLLYHAYKEGDSLSGPWGTPTLLNYNNRTFNGNSDYIVYSAPGLASDMPTLDQRNYPESFTTGETFRQDLPIARGDAKLLRVYYQDQRIPAGDPPAVNALFNIIDGENNPTLQNKPYVLNDDENEFTTGGNKILIIPYERSSTGGLHWDCYAYTIAADGSPSLPLTSDLLNPHYNDSDVGSVSTHPLAASRLFNPIYTNGVSTTTTPDMLQDSNFNQVFYSDDYLTPGTVVTMDGNDYVVFYIGQHLVTVGNTMNAYIFYNWDGSTVDWTGAIPTMSPNPQTINTVNQTYFATNADASGLTIADSAINPREVTFYYNTFFGASRYVTNNTDKFTAVALDQNGSTLDVLDLGTVDSTIGEVIEVYTPPDSSQKAKRSFTDSTEGFVAISTTDPAPYELRDLELVMPGTQVYSYLDSGGNTVYGAEVEPDWYYDSGLFEPTYLGGTSPEEVPNFTVGVDGSGYLNGTFTMALKPSATTFGRFRNGDTICFPIRSQPNEYTPPVVTDAEQQDIWDTDDEWTTNGFDTRKEWPYHVSPSKATINLNAPTIVNKSQNGIKYSRKSSHTKWTLEVEYPPMTADDFSLFHATAQAAQGQAVPFYFVLRNKDNTPILWADFMRTIDSGDVTQTFRYMDNYSAGDTVMMLDGFDSFETDAFRKGEVFIGSGNENGSLHTVINQVDANAYGEAKVRLAYPLRSGVSKAGSGYKDVYHAIVTLNSDDFMYQIDTDGYYRMSVSFDLDGWK